MNVLESRDKLSILIINSERTDFLEVSGTIRASGTTLQPEDQRSVVIKGGSSVGGTTSRVGGVEDLGLGLVVDSEVASVEFGLIGDSYGNGKGRE